MIDKTVGELLQQRLADLEARYPDRSGVKAFELDMVISLIRKLVEERTSKIAFARRINLYEARPIALRDFGIPEETWPDGR